MTTKGVPRRCSTPTSPATGWPPALQPLVLPHLALQAPHSHPHHAIPHISSPVPQVCPGPGPHTREAVTVHSPSSCPSSAPLWGPQHHPHPDARPRSPQVLSAEDPAQTAKETVRTALTSSRKHSHKTLKPVPVSGSDPSSPGHPILLQLYVPISLAQGSHLRRLSFSFLGHRHHQFPEHTLVRPSFLSGWSCPTPPRQSRHRRGHQAEGSVP